MAKHENNMKKRLLDDMGKLWDVQSHEDRYSEGIPDLSFGALNINGWIELKQVPNWPRLKDTKVSISHYTSQQVNWLRLRGKKGGSCWVLIRISVTFFLFYWTEARALRRGYTKEEYYENAVRYWDGKIVPTELIDTLTTYVGQRNN